MTFENVWIALVLVVVGAAVLFLLVALWPGWVKKGRVPK